jgi:hypothetical protein
MPPRTVAIIGSFRQFYKEVLEAHEIFRKNGIVVTSPKGDAVSKDGIPFVRFKSDSETLDDPSVQVVALHRILRADAVYVVAPAGYVGNTTCYEIGRVVQAAKPLFFSEPPQDLPIRVPNRSIVSASELAELLLTAKDGLPSLHAEGDDYCSQLERRLLTRHFLDS